MLFPKELHSAISTDQLKHLCMTFENDDVIYFRFDVKKALQFLKRKHERVLECLIRQDQVEQQRKDQLYESSFSQYKSGGKASDSGGETGGESETSSGSSGSPAVVLSDTKALKLQSIQIVCNYLTEAWANKLVGHLGVTMDQVQNKVSKTKPAASRTDNTTTTTPSNNTAAAAPTSGYSIQQVVETENADAAARAKAAADKKALESYRTAGNKRLAKVNTKGMKSIASFFGGAPKSKKAKH
ncbi:MAG: hypothetical protein SGARI_007972 [Bacillariaceae sp.]